ncbi:MAG: hypothetical protein ACI9F9_001332, partial [Candidatus Paceibacteria bacterium]
AGTWESESLGAHESEGNSEFRVSAGGSFVEERTFVGTPREMLTVYHMDGAKLLATHYCMMGNAPHLEAGPLDADGALEFRCNGKPSNVTSHDDSHIHGWRMRLQEGQLLNDVVMFSAGKASAKDMEFRLTRK